jgi:protein O-mannosyl-transferase
MQANLGNALSEIPGRLPDAIEHLEAAVRIRPDFAEAHYLLGVALLRSPGRAKEALGQLDEAQRLQPDPKLGELIGRLRAKIR